MSHYNSSDPQQLHKEITDLRSALEAKDQEIAELRRCLKEPVLDALTGLAHRRALDRFLKAAEEEGCSDSRLSLILIDLDDFKQINGSFAHRSGDTLLRQFADLLQDTASSAAIITRYGADKFLLAIREPIGVAYNLAELIRTQTEAGTFQSPR